MMSHARPPRTYETGRGTLWVRRITVVSTVVLTALILVRYPALPETIPTHFTFTGEADGWGPRWMIFLLVIPLAALALAMVWLSTRPQVFNYPLTITEVNAQPIYREGERMMVWTTLAVVMLYAGTAAATFGLNGSLLVGAGALGIVLTLIAGIVRLVMASKTSDESEAHTSRR